MKDERVEQAFQACGKAVSSAALATEVGASRFIEEQGSPRRLKPEIVVLLPQAWKACSTP